MTFIKIFLVLLLIFYLIAVLINIKKMKKPFTFLGLQTAVVIFFFLIINLTGFATNQYIPVNEATVIGGFLGGIPFLVLILLAKSIFLL